MGRPSKDNYTIKVNEIQINLLSQKQDKYNNEIVYFKVVDVNAKTKMKQLLAMYDNPDSPLKLPFFIGETGDIILRVKERFINAPTITELEKKTYLANLEFKYYTYVPPEQTDINYTGYFLKLPLMVVSPTQIV